MLGVVEVSYALLDQHVVTKLTREGSNLISRDTSLQDAATALKSMSGRPVNFNTQLEGDLLGGAQGRDHRHQQLRQGHAVPALRVRRAVGVEQLLQTPRQRRRSAPRPTTRPPTPTPTPTCRSPTCRRASSLATGGMLYVTEIFTQHELITPFDKFGVTVPKTLYSIAYF